MFTALHPLALILSLLYSALYKGRQQGRVELPGDDTEHPALYNGAGDTPARAAGPEGPRRPGADEENQEGAREIDTDAVWS